MKKGDSLLRVIALGLSDVLGLVELAPPSAMNECVRLIIGGDREREGERGKRSVDRFDPEQPGRP